MPLGLGAFLKKTQNLPSVKSRLISSVVANHASPLLPPKDGGASLDSEDITLATQQRGRILGAFVWSNVARIGRARPSLQVYILVRTAG